MDDGAIRRRPAQLTFGFGVPLKRARGDVQGGNVSLPEDGYPQDGDLAEALKDLRAVLLRRGGIG